MENDLAKELEVVNKKLEFYEHIYHQLADILFVEDEKGNTIFSNHDNIDISLLQQDVNLTDFYDEKNDIWYRLSTKKIVSPFDSTNFWKIKKYTNITIHKELEIDKTTGLLIKDKFIEKINNLDQLGVEKVILAVVDIDFFKQINDTYGHGIGDEVLLKVANILKTTLRKSDLVGRYGGDEFLIAFTNTDCKQAYYPLADLSFKLQNITIGIKKIPLTISIGMVEYDQQLSFEANFKKADQALYFSKKKGRNRISNYDDIKK